ncbi:hypothetical protein ACFXP7_08330 [Microbacterium sp. P06]|uniref:hypothetical protein n=1 Tax=Microbacterium sp. P06 TaxID=3366949 RepID=UPI003745A689
MNDTTAAEAAQLRRMVPRMRRILADEAGGVPRAALRRRISSREKHLYDAALDLLIAVGDVVAVPAGSGGTRYRLTDSARKTAPGSPSLRTTTTDEDA